MWAIHSRMRRRDLLAGLAATPLMGCKGPRDMAGGFTGVSHERGHLLRSEAAPSLPATTTASIPTQVRRTRVLVLGAGVAGLAAARALQQRGVQDFAILELEDTAGGNARGSTLGGMRCPIGAHYLPVPGPEAHEVADLLEELGLRRRVAGRWVYDERHLCHSPQERLYFQGQWQDGLLPLADPGSETQRQYQRFAALVESARGGTRWSMPAARSPWNTFKATLARQTFAAWLESHGLTDARLRWYLDYCCRDDYGAGLQTVSAWAGLHYFASRHGFSAPGARDTVSEGVLTWPEGNGWLTQRMGTSMAAQLQTGRVVLRVGQSRHGVEVLAHNVHTQSTERWEAAQAIVALPVHVATRVVDNPPAFLTEAARRTVHAPWLVANLQLERPLVDRPGAAPSWDNVIYGDATSAPGLGYVDAMHQSLTSVPGATVLTYYRALGDVAGGALQGRRLLLERSWADWRDAIVQELSAPHPDLREKTVRMDITRHGHAMAIPVPHTGDAPLSEPPRFDRLLFAHSDWAGYSVFEEAFTLGHVAGQRALR